MSRLTRRDFVQDVGRGMLVAGLGAGAAAELGLAPAWAGDEPGRLTFGDLEPLVAFMQETPPDRLLVRAVEKWRAGTPLKTLVAAAALANARAFGGEDYVGFHTLMALPPAFHIAAEEDRADRRPLAVLKVLVRNATRLGEAGATATDRLHPVAADPSTGRPGAEGLREAVRRTDLPAAERAFAAIARGSADDALNQLIPTVADATEVHRTVLVSRSWELLGFVGADKAHTLLRQSVHYCVKAEKSGQYVTHSQPVRALVPRLIDQHHLLGRPVKAREVDDGWVERMADTLFRVSPEQAAEAAAAALAEGISAEAIGEAIALAANQLVLRDAGRPKAWAQPNKPVGSVHGDSIGVHACDSVNAWRALARAGDGRTRVTSMILAAYQVARDRTESGGDFAKWEPYPRPEHKEAVRNVPTEALERELAAAVRAKDQGRAAALADRLGRERTRSADAFVLLRGFAVSEDGALHAEKFYRTASEEFAAARPAFRWRQLVALARVTASAYGYPAPGYKDACRLLGVSEDPT